jgi:hypothetical protein
MLGPLEQTFRRSSNLFRAADWFADHTQDTRATPYPHDERSGARSDRAGCLHTPREDARSDLHLYHLQPNGDPVPLSQRKAQVLFGYVQGRQSRTEAGGTCGQAARETLGSTRGTSVSRAARCGVTPTCRSFSHFLFPGSQHFSLAKCCDPYKGEGVKQIRIHLSSLHLSTEMSRKGPNVFEPSKNGSPLGQKMDEPWPKLPFSGGF